MPLVRTSVAYVSYLFVASSMSKILFVTNDFGPRAGGIESFILGLIERLPKNCVTVYTSSQGDTSEYDQNWLREFGVNVIRDRAKILLPTPRVAQAVGRLVKKSGIEVACFGAATPLGLLAPTLRGSGVQRIVSLTHGHEVWWARVFPFSWALRRIGDSVDVLTFLGEFTHRKISSALSKKAAAAMVQIAPGIDSVIFAPRKVSDEFLSSHNLLNKRVILCVGRLVQRKGQDRLIEALGLIRTAVPSAHLLIVGEGAYRSALEKIANRNGLTDAVTFVGKVSLAELPTFFSAGEVFAMPSRSRFGGLEIEGLGIVYLEASSCGLPIVAGNSGGAPDAVLDGVTGIVVDGTNVGEIARAIIELLSDPVRAQRMGKAGRQWVADQWSWESWSEKFRKLLQS